MNYPWYDIVEGAGLEQGDCFDECPVLVPRQMPSERSDTGLKAEIHTCSVIVLTQSCDLPKSAQKTVLLCHRATLEVAEQSHGSLRSPQGREDLRRGNIPGLYLLNRCDIDGFDRGYEVVNFRQPYVLPNDLLSEYAQGAGRRLRLLPPCREHLSQGFARFFMRVGLPEDIPDDYAVNR